MILAGISLLKRYHKTIKMKVTLTLILLALGMASYAQAVDMEGYWVAVQSKPIKNKWPISPMDGLVLGFKGKQVEMRHVYSDSIFKFPLKIKKEKMFFQDSLFGKLRHLDSDSILIDFDGKMRVKFKPLAKGWTIDESLDFNESTDWIFSYNRHKKRLKLLQKPWFYSSDTGMKLCIVQWSREKYRSVNMEKWNVISFNNYHLFIKSTGQFEDEIYQVKSYRRDTILLKDLTYCDTSEVRLVKEKSISQSEKEGIIRKLQNKKWNTYHLISKATSMIGASDEEEITGFYVMDTTLLKKESLENNKLSFVFTDSFTYKIYEDDTVVRSGNWRLSNNGAQIILDAGYMPYDYIDLIKIQPDSIAIGKNDEFHVDGNSFIEYYYRLRLKKE